MSFSRLVTAHLVSLGLLLGVAVPAAAQTVTRGPYLQSGTPASMIVKWRTSTSTNARVRYGLDPANLIDSADQTTVTADHEVKVMGLTPDTKYFYSIGTTTATLAGGNATHFLITPPVQGTSKATRVWILGDSGRKAFCARSSQHSCMNARRAPGGRALAGADEIVLTLGSSGRLGVRGRPNERRIQPENGAPS